MTEIISIVANVATAIGVLVAAWQLLLAHRQAVANFEDKFDQEYRRIVASLPTKALLGEELSDEEHAKAFDEFYHYFDLCNSQAFHHKTKRITRKTWRFWLNGMRAHFARPAFRKVWLEVASRSGSDFSELRDLFPSEPS